MSTDRQRRLGKLVLVQERLKAFHEARRAGFVADAAAAEREAAELADRFDEPGSMSVLFPELYHQRIGRAVARRDTSTEKAREEAGHVATASARTDMVERAYREVIRRDDRAAADKERLENIERGNTDEGK